MDLITALAVVIGLLGGIATYALLSPFGYGLQIWAAFIGWASFYHCGGKGHGLRSSTLANLWGVLWATLTLLAVTKAGMSESLGLPVWAAICVAIGVGLMIFGANVPGFGAIPAQVYGYAATVAFALLTNTAGALTEPSLANPAIAIALSLVLGNVLGYISEAIAGSLAKARTAAAREVQTTPWRYFCCARDRSTASG